MRSVAGRSAARHTQVGHRRGLGRSICCFSRPPAGSGGQVLAAQDGLEIVRQQQALGAASGRVEVHDPALKALIHEVRVARIAARLRGIGAPQTSRLISGLSLPDTLAAFYFGRNSPARTALGALLFGFFDAAQIRLQGRGVPAELVQTLPYVIVIVVLTGLGVADWRAARERTL